MRSILEVSSEQLLPYMQLTFANHFRCLQEYVRPNGVLIYSTCTIGADENQYNLKWFLENYPFRLESIDPYICEELKGKTTAGGYIQLLPGVHESDGFFIARLRRLKEEE